MENHFKFLRKYYYIPGQVRDHDSCKSEDETNNSEADEEHPPHPENKEVLLVEDIVVEDAEVVAPVNGTSGGSNVDVAGHLSGEQLAHGIMGVVLS